jgi:hypothetical protein
MDLEYKIQKALSTLKYFNIRVEITVTVPVTITYPVLAANSKDACEKVTDILNMTPPEALQQQIRNELMGREGLPSTCNVDPWAATIADIPLKLTASCDDDLKNESY